MKIQKIWIGILVCLVGWSGTVQAESLSSVFKRVVPSVVVIHSVERGRLASNPDITGTSIQIGSGVVVSEDGLVITAAHVVQVADVVEVKFLDGTTVIAKIISSVPWADLALLKLDKLPSNLAVAELGDSDTVMIGDQIFVVGAPQSFEYTLTVGHIGARRYPQVFSWTKKPYEFLQTDAAIDVGNSGGPMFSMNGKVIGIVSQFFPLSKHSGGLGMVASVNTAKDLLLNKKRFWSGLELYPLPVGMAKALNLPQRTGLLVQRVAKNSPGHLAGLRPGKIRIVTGELKLLIGGDIILEVEGIQVSMEQENLERIVQRITKQLEKKKPLHLKVLREGKIVKIKLVVGKT